MLNHCPECGVKLDKDYNFCPNCGYDLREAKKDFVPVEENIEDKPAHSEVIVCDVCGEENPVENEVCIGCGAKLDKSNVVEKEEPLTSKSEQTKKEKPVFSKPPVKKETPKQRKMKSTGHPKVENVKKLDTGKFAALSIIVIGALFIIMLFAGVFDLQTTPTTNVTTNQMNTDQPTVNLNNVQRINALEEQIKNNPENHQAVLELAHLLNDSGMYERAIEKYKQYLETHPENPDARIDMGVCYYNLGNYETAITEMKKALEYSPNHQIGHLNLGIVNLTAGNLETSKEWLNKAVELNPANDVGKKAQELLESH